MKLLVCSSFTNALKPDQTTTLHLPTECTHPPLSLKMNIISIEQNPSQERSTDACPKKIEKILIITKYCRKFDFSDKIFNENFIYSNIILELKCIFKF